MELALIRTKVVVTGFLNWAIPIVVYFVFSTAASKYIYYKILPMAGFEPQTSGIGNNCFAN